MVSESYTPWILMSNNPHPRNRISLTPAHTAFPLVNSANRKALYIHRGLALRHLSYTTFVESQP